MGFSRSREVRPTPSRPTWRGGARQDWRVPRDCLTWHAQYEHDGPLALRLRRSSGVLPGPSGRLQCVAAAAAVQRSVLTHLHPDADPARALARARRSAYAGPVDVEVPGAAYTAGAG